MVALANSNGNKKMHFHLLVLACWVVVIVKSDVVARPAGPLALTSQYDLILSTAEKSLAAYDLENLPNNGNVTSEVMNAKKDGAVKSILVFLEEEERCFAIFRGPTQGFEWVADNIDMSVAYMNVRNKRRKKCRVVKHYKKLYLNKGSVNRYKKNLDNKLTACWQAGKTVVLAGHGLGGALATLGALEYAAEATADLLWAVTFGQPPVFMPPAYINPRKPRFAQLKKNPCKFINLATYVPFVNTEMFPFVATSGQTAGPMYYDFMVFLNVLLYGIADGKEPAITLDCLVQAGENTRLFLDDPDTRGNLGSQFGKRYLFPGVNVSERSTSLAFLDLNETFPRHIDFANQGNINVSYGMLMYPFEDDCSTAPFSHNMQTYLDKIVFYGPIGTIPPFNQQTWEQGFMIGEVCRVDTDCVSGFCQFDLGNQTFIGFDGELTSYGTCQLDPRGGRRGKMRGTLGQRKNK